MFHVCDPLEQTTVSLPAKHEQSSQTTQRCVTKVSQAFLRYMRCWVDALSRHTKDEHQSRMSTNYTEYCPSPWTKVSSVSGPPFVFENQTSSLLLCLPDLFKASLAIQVQSCRSSLFIPASILHTIVINTLTSWQQYKPSSILSRSRRQTHPPHHHHLSLSIYLLRHQSTVLLLAFVHRHHHQELVRSRRLPKIKLSSPVARFVASVAILRTSIRTSFLKHTTSNSSSTRSVKSLTFLATSHTTARRRLLMARLADSGSMVYVIHSKRDKKLMQAQCSSTPTKFLETRRNTP